MYSRVGRAATQLRSMIQLMWLEQTIATSISALCNGEKCLEKVDEEPVRVVELTFLGDSCLSERPSSEQATLQETITYPTLGKFRKLSTQSAKRQGICDREPWRFKDALNFSFTILIWHQSWNFSQAAPAVLGTTNQEKVSNCCELFNMDISRWFSLWSGKNPLTFIKRQIWVRNHPNMLFVLLRFKRFIMI